MVSSWWLMSFGFFNQYFTIVIKFHEFDLLDALHIIPSWNVIKKNTSHQPQTQNLE
jgi:uncharacterized membrane protein